MVQQVTEQGKNPMWLTLLMTQPHKDTDENLKPCSALVYGTAEKGTCRAQHSPTPCAPLSCSLGCSHLAQDHPNPQCFPTFPPLFIFFHLEHTPASQFYPSLRYLMGFVDKASTDRGKLSRGKDLSSDPQTPPEGPPHVGWFDLMIFRFYNGGKAIGIQ